MRRSKRMLPSTWVATRMGICPCRQAEAGVGGSAEPCDDSHLCGPKLIGVIEASQVALAGLLMHGVLYVAR